MQSTTNNERIDTRLEKHLKEVSEEIRLIHVELVKLQALYSTYDTQSKKNADDIEKLKTDNHLLKGGMNLFKIIATLSAGALIAFFTWIVQANNFHEKKYIELEHSVRMLEHDLKMLGNQKVESVQ